MAKENQKTKVWRLGAIPGVPDLLVRSLRALETTVQRLQGRVESMPPQAGSRATVSANTLINVNAPGTIVLPGMTVTFMPEADCVALVIADFHVACATFGSIVEAFKGILLVDGVVAGPQAAQCAFVAVNEQHMECQSWLIPLSGGKAHTLAFVAQMTGGTTTCNCFAGNSGFTYVLFPDFYKYPL